MKTRRGSKSSAETSESRLRKRARFKRADAQEDQVKTIEEVDEADSRIQEPVDQVASGSDQEDGSVEMPMDQVAPGSDQIEECNSDQVIDSSNLLWIAVKCKF